ncbi:aldehyde dehydrogenase family protein, partial [Saccharothrix lopnurensis]
MTDMRAPLDVQPAFDGSAIDLLPHATDDDVAGAVRIAREALPGWAATPGARRGAALRAAA